MHRPWKVELETPCWFLGYPKTLLAVGSVIQWIPKFHLHLPLPILEPNALTYTRTTRNSLTEITKFQLKSIVHSYWFGLVVLARNELKLVVFFCWFGLLHMLTMLGGQDMCSHVALTTAVNSCSHGRLAFSDIIWVISFVSVSSILISVVFL